MHATLWCVPARIYGPQAWQRQANARLASAHVALALGHTDKNDLVKAERGVSFEQMTVAVGAGGLLDLLTHPNPPKYPNQKIPVIACDDYACQVPFVEEADHFFLEAVYPSRKPTRHHLMQGEPDADT